jgi:hypothetical protein
MAVASINATDHKVTCIGREGRKREPPDPSGHNGYTEHLRISAVRIHL